MTEDEQLMYSTVEEQQFWLNAVKGLPGLEGFSGTGYDAEGNRIPWGSGPHNLNSFRKIVEIVEPASILEIGMNMDYGTIIWLELCPCKIVSIEIRDTEETRAAAKFMFDKYKSRFHCITADSSKIHWLDLSSRLYDMIFIDGGHLEENVTADIQLARQLEIPWIVLDDWLPRFGPGVQIAAKKFPLELVKVFGNVALMKWKDS